MNGSTQVTVVVCTYNRCQSLAQALESVTTQTLPPSIGWEIVVVDNNSSDETPQVVEDFRRRYPERIRYLLEVRQGVSYARNAGIQHANGNVVAFIDDDETAAPGWLQGLTANLHSSEWAGAGGRVVPQWNGLRPRWLSSEDPFLSAPLAAFDADREKEQLTEPPFGANMAVRKDIFDRYGGFRTDLGRMGKNLLSNEDTEFGRRVLAEGARFRYEPSALTYHPVEEYRLHRSYFLAWWFNKGRSDVREMGIPANQKRFMGIPVRSFSHIAAEALRWTFTLEPSRRFICKLKIWALVGEAYEAFRQACDAKRDGTERNSGVRARTADEG
jgi:glycosyltransferase involved in cell wall biosynthesis